MTSKNKYTVRGRLNGGTNFAIFLEEIPSSVLWVGKVFKDDRRHAAAESDLNYRAILAYRLARQVNTCIPEKKLIDLSAIEFSPDLERLLEDLDQHPIHQDHLLVSRYEGISLPNFLKVSPLGRIRNLDELLRNMVFNLWIGNYDKKEADYVVNNDYWGHSIDYSLWGPGFVDDLRQAIGAYFQTYDFLSTWDTGWTVADVFLQKIAKRALGPEFFGRMVDCIQDLSTDSIKEAFQNLRFYRFGTSQRIDNEFIEYLLERKSGLRKAVAEWCHSGFPKARRIPEN